MTKQTRTREGSFEEKFSATLKNADISYNSRYECMRKYLIEILSSKPLCREIERRKAGFKLFREYNPDINISYSDLGLATYKQIKKSLGYYELDTLRGDGLQPKLTEIMPQKDELSLVQTEFTRYGGQGQTEYRKILAVITKSMLSNRRVVIPTIKEILLTFKFNQKTLEKEVLEGVADLGTEGLFSN